MTLDSNKRYQVFVSSTFTDLEVERKEVIQALLELDCIPAGMELFQASDDDSWTLIQRVINDCDYYLVIVAGRYGSVHPDTGVSFTEMEYEFAKSLNKPILAFIHENTDDIRLGNVETSQEAVAKLISFKEKLKERQVKYWKSADQLGSAISRSVIRLIKDKPSEGWVRADSLASAEARDQILKLKFEVESLKAELSEAKGSYDGDRSNLVRGSDQFPINFYWKWRDKSNQVRYTLTQQDSCEFDELFEGVATITIDEATEHQLKAHFEKRVAFMFDGLEYEFEFDDGKKMVPVKMATPEDESFQSFKVQCLALNLIQKGQKKRAPSDKSTYWKLTSEGEKEMMRLLALTKPGVQESE
ncbi:MAG: DUF4062 domain-containing protein [Sphingomonadales bacterium]